MKRKRYTGLLLAALAVLAAAGIILVPLMVRQIDLEKTYRQAANQGESELSYIEAEMYRVSQDNQQLVGMQGSIQEEQQILESEIKVVSGEREAAQSLQGSWEEALNLLESELSSAQETYESVSAHVSQEEQSAAESRAQEEARLAAESRAQEEARLAAESRAQEESRLAAEAQSKAQDQTYNANGKTVYLTFDDGPSYLTPQVLDILDRYGIKATFFVIHTDNPSYVPYYKEIVNRGHTIAVHSYSHSYDEVYASFENYQADFMKMYNYIYEQTGVRCTLSRFIGGSSNMTIRGPAGFADSARNMLNSMGVVYFDWNVANGDGERVTADQAYHNVIDSIRKRRHPLILMHDGEKKETTVESLPGIIEQLLAWGYSFEELTVDSIKIQQGISWDPM